ncbi:MAG: GTP-binding protein [Planctomycetota bacterium]
MDVEPREREPVPVTIVGGFLGSGKTTLLNRALRGDHGRKIAVIVNELGEIGLDAELLEGGESFVELDNGCLCCALKEDLVATLGELGEREDLDQVLIETTGIADPLPVGNAVTRPELEGRFALDAVIITVDSLNLERAFEAGLETQIQIGCADFLVLTKTDGLTADRMEFVRSTLTAINPRAHMFESCEPGVFQLLLGEALVGQESSLFTEPKVSIDDGHAHGFKSLSVDVGNRSTIRLCFEEFLEELPRSVYRAKGIVKLDGERGRLVFQHVAGRCELEHDSERSGDGRLVFIGKDFDREKLRTEVESLFEVY